jgi:hypothetical protein
MRSLVRIVLGVTLLSMVAAGVVACQSGQGEHCQVASDCESGLKCTSLGFCEKNPAGDASVTPDFDAAPDASGSLPIDATPMPDAPPGPDAAADARLPDSGT